MQAIREQLAQITPGDETLMRRLNLVQFDLLLTIFSRSITILSVM